PAGPGRRPRDHRRGRRRVLRHARGPGLPDPDVLAALRHLGAVRGRGDPGRRRRAVGDGAPEARALAGALARARHPHVSTASLREIAGAFLRLGATSYGGFAIMGIMQSELQERRGWVSKPRFVEGLAVVNMLPGATATQLAIFLAYARGGWWGAVVGGLGFVLPAFVIMRALSLAYATVGVSPVVRGALYGLGPVVIGVFAVALYRLGRSTVRSATHAAIAVAAALVMLVTPLGLAG